MLTDLFAQGASIANGGEGNHEFLTGLVLGAFIVWIVTRRGWKTLRRRRKTLWTQLTEQTQKSEQLLQTRQAAKNRAKELDLGDYSNQIKFIERAILNSRKPINAESFRAVYAILEQSLEPGYRILAEISLGSFIGTYNKSYSDYAGDLAFRSINSKRVDFLIIGPFGHPLLAIEYHGSGHFQGNAESRDAVKRLIFQKVGIPLLEFEEGVSADSVKDAVFKILR